MFDLLKKDKQQLAQTQQNLAAAQKYSTMQLQQAKKQTEAFLASPTGISAAFAAGAVKGASANVSTPPASLIFSIASEFL